MDKSLTKKKKINTAKNFNTTYVPNMSNSSPITIREAEKRIQNSIILQAWRSQKNRNKELEVDIKNLSNQVESLQLQIYALRQLLESEKTRVVHVNYDLRKIIGALEESNHEKRALIKEKEQLEVHLHNIEDKLLGVENECKNQKNELITVKMEAQNWEKQLEKEREKLLKIKDERKFDEDAQETREKSKETTSNNNGRKSSRDSRAKNISCKSGKKSSGRGREDRGSGKVDFGKNVGCIKKLLKDSLSLFDEPD